jgi:competence protein ComGC
MRMHHKAVSGLSMLLIVSFLLVLQPPTARAQKRVSDKDMERMMKNLRYDTKSFRPMFDHALGKSTIRKTSQAKDAKNLVATFQSQVDAMLTTFKTNRNDGTAVASAVNTAGQIDSLLHSVSLGPEVTSQWQKIREELHPIAVSYGVQESYRDDRTNGMAGDDSVSCLQSAGAVKANRLVNECLEVSPATHPPCNAQNACSLIISEIRRGCSMLGQGAPGFCAEYR